MSRIQFIYPTEGDMLTDRAGTLHPDGTLEIEVMAESDAPVFIGGSQAAPAGDGRWTARVLLKEDKTSLCASAGGDSAEITVYRLRKATGKYALSVDDNIWWLAELTQGDYPSIFDHPYLAVFKRAHDEFGAKVRFNLFYMVEGAATGKYGPFNLSLMTDRYKDEFRRNSDWLHFAFHSLQESPANPYREGTYAQLKADCTAVHREIIRFAGEDSLEWVTTVHFGCCSPDGILALRDLGMRGLMGYIALNRDGNPYVSYNLSAQKVLETQRYGFWRDPETGMVYGKINAVMNLYSPERVVEVLTEEADGHPLRGFVEIMIHEQYFHSDYSHYEPDFAERVMAGCRWCHEHGYEGTFAEDVI